MSKRLIYLVMYSMILGLLCGCGAKISENVQLEDHNDLFQKLNTDKDNQETSTDNNSMTFEEAVKINQDGLDSMSTEAQIYVENNDLPSDYFQVKSVITDGFNPNDEELERALSDYPQFIGESFKNDELSYYISQYTQYAIIRYCVDNNIADGIQFDYVDNSIQTSDVSSNVIELNVEAPGILLKITYDMSTDNVIYEQL